MLAAALADIDPVVAELTADRLAAAQILAPVRPLEFFHPLIGAAVYADIPLWGRRVAHRRAAELVDREGERPVARTAAHLLSCGAARRSLGGRGIRRSAAREAVATGAPESASRYLERALGETQPPALRAELLLELGETQLQAGLPGATERFRRARDLSTDPHRRTEICIALGRARFSAGDWVGAREAFRDGVAELPDGDADLALELHHWCVTVGLDGLPAVVDERVRARADGDAPGRTRIERVRWRISRSLQRDQGRDPTTRSPASLAGALADGALRHDGATDLVPHFGACRTLVDADETEARPPSAITRSSRASAPARPSLSTVLPPARSRRLLSRRAPRGDGGSRSSNDVYSEGQGRGCPERVRSSRCV